MRVCHGGDGHYDADPMADSEQRSPEGDGRGGRDSLYTKSGGRSSRMRLLDEQPKKKLLDVEIGGLPGGRKQRPTSRHSPFQHIFKMHLKQMLVVGGLMVALLVAVTQLHSMLSSRDVSSTKTSVSSLPKPPPKGEQAGADLLPKPPTNQSPFGPGAISPDVFKRAVFLLNKARAHDAAGEHEKAISAYRESLEVLPSQPVAWAEMGKIYLKQKDYWQAQISLEKAVESNPSADLFNDLGVALLWQEGKAERALNMFQTALDVDANYAPTYFNRALAHLARNDPKRATESLEQFLRMKADDPRGLRELAVIKARDGRRKEALRDLETAIAQAPEWPLLYFDSAAINALLGQCDTAIRFLERAEPLAGPAAVFKLWQEPAFKECRISEQGKTFEKEIADRARDLLNEQTKPPVTSSEPILSPGK